MKTTNGLRELLPVKKLVKAIPTELRLSISPCGKHSKTHRVRIVIDAKQFREHLYDVTRDGLHPRSEVSGSASEGLILYLTQHGSNKVNFQTQSTVYAYATSRQIHGNESTVSLMRVKGVFAEYEDGSRYLLIEPLPDKFLASSTQRFRQHSEDWRPMVATAMAFEMAGIEFTRAKSERKLIPDELLQEPTEPIPESTSQPKTHVSGLSGVAENMGDFTELKTAFSLVKDAIARLREGGQEVELFVNGDGELRARAPVTVYREI